MTAGPAQTPCAFVKGTGQANWSDECVAHLLKAGYEPDTFGDYDHTKKKIDEAKARVKAWNKMTDAEKAKSTKPPDSDFYLARCESGHLSQDGTHRASGSRGNNCGNLYDGYNHDMAPCMPQSGPSTAAGTEHNLASRHEAACSLAVGQQSGYGNGQYPVGLRDQHERDRIQRVVDHNDSSLEPHERRRPLTPAEYAQNQATRAKIDSAGKKGGPAVGTPGAPGTAAAPGSGGPTTGATKAPGINGNNAAECIDNFRKQGLKQMRARAAVDRKTNSAARRAEHATHNEGQLKTNAANERAKADAAREAAGTSARSDGQYQHHSRNASQDADDAWQDHAMSRDPRSGFSSRDQSILRREARMAEANAGRRERQADASAAQRADAADAAHQQELAANRAESAYDRVRDLRCQAEEGDRWAGGDLSRRAVQARAVIYPQSSPLNQTAPGDIGTFGISGR